MRCKSCDVVLDYNVCRDLELCKGCLTAVKDHLSYEAYLTEITAELDEQDPEQVWEEVLSASGLREVWCDGLFSYSGSRSSERELQKHDRFSELLADGMAPTVAAEMALGLNTNSKYFTT